MIPSLDILIVNYNARDQLRECLQSITTASRSSFRLGQVVVVDNASTDGSADRLADLQLPLKLVRNEINQGFGRACNQGAAHCTSDYLLLLNPDTRLFAASLEVPIAFMEQTEQKDLAVVGIQLVDQQGHISRACARLPTASMFVGQALGFDFLFPKLKLSPAMVDWDHAQSRDVDHVVGAFYLMRRVVFEQVGRFDERFFMYYEDLDLSLRIHRAGYRVRYLTEAQAFHKGGGTSDQVKAKRMFYSTRSRILYGFKHFGFIRAVLMAFGIMCLEPITRLIYYVLKRRPTDLRESMAGYALFWRTLPGVFRPGWTRRA